MTLGCIIYTGDYSLIYKNWHGQMLWQHAYNLARDFTDKIYIVGVDLDIGRNRQESVRETLNLIDTERVLILELSKPLVTDEHIQRILRKRGPSITFGHPADIPIYNALSKLHFDTTNFFFLQGPQVFDTQLLKEAHRKTSLVNTREDTIIMKAVHGIEPTIIPGDRSFLYDIQTKEDIRRLEALA